jgi:hypothetical protein
MRRFAVAAVMVGVVASASRAERPPEYRKDADAILVGKVTKVTTKEEKFGGDGVMTHYTADVEVTKVEKGEDVKAGETVTVKWFRVTKRPTRPIAGAFGHSYPVKEKDEAKFWLMGSAKKGFDVIYNKDGVEKVTK